MIKARDSLDPDWCRHRKVSSLKAPNVTNALKGSGVLWTWAQLLGGRDPTLPGYSQMVQKNHVFPSLCPFVSVTKQKVVNLEK